MDKILLELSNHAQEDLINDLMNFISWLNYKNLSQNTIKGYLSDIKQSLVFFANSCGEKINHNMLISLPKSTYLSLIAQYAQTKSQKSQERLISTWKTWHKYKLQKDKLEISFTNIKPPKSKNKLVPNIEIEAIIKLLNAQMKEKITWQSLRNRSLILLLYSCGLRINEAINLKWEDVHFNKEKSYAKIIGKGNKLRYVPILPDVQSSLIEYQKLLNKTHDNINENYVFLSPKFTKWHACSAERYFRKLIEKNNLQKLTPHSLRHACATHLLKSGCNLKSIQELLGHSNLETTKHYIQHSTNELMDIHNKIIDKT